MTSFPFSDPSVCFSEACLDQDPTKSSTVASSLHLLCTPSASDRQWMLRPYSCRTKRQINSKEKRPLTDVQDTPQMVRWFPFIMSHDGKFSIGWLNTGWGEKQHPLLFPPWPSHLGCISLPVFMTPQSIKARSTDGFLLHALTPLAFTSSFPLHTSGKAWLPHFN